MNVRIQTGDFDIGAECEALMRANQGIGALATFAGLVRGDDNLVSLTLEHYPGMTEREIGRHIDEARTRWPVIGASVVHRIGRLVPGDRIVLVGVVSSHRADSFAACEFLMDYLKTRAPFWKREERAGRSTWVGAKCSDEAAAARWKEPPRGS
jgi:molybdopterin synthase catalytic subunit